ncbi:MAG: redoxin domain-containing protein [Bryobacteraceae bacterium]
MLRRSIALGILACGLQAAEPPGFRLRDTAGVMHSESEWRTARAVVLVFLAIDCPISNGYVPELRRIAEKYRAVGVSFYAVQSGVIHTADEAATFVREFAFPFPLLVDPRSALASYAGADTTPEVAVLSPAGQVRYLGRIDNLYVQIGQKRYAASAFDLRDALDQVLAGKPVARARTTAVGCSIPKG